MRKGERILFVRGFAKRDMDNITDMELAAYQSLVVRALGANEAIVAELLTGGEWIEVNTDA